MYGAPDVSPAQTKPQANPLDGSKATRESVSDPQGAKASGNGRQDSTAKAVEDPESAAKAAYQKALDEGKSADEATKEAAAAAGKAAARAAEAEGKSPEEIQASAAEAAQKAGLANGLSDEQAAASGQRASTSAETSGNSGNTADTVRGKNKSWFNWMWSWKWPTWSTWSMQNEAKSDGSEPDSVSSKTASGSPNATMDSVGLRKADLDRLDAILDAARLGHFMSTSRIKWNSKHDM